MRNTFRIKNGGKVEQTGTREYGRANLTSVDTENPLFRGFDSNSQVWIVMVIPLQPFLQTAKL